MHHNSNYLNYSSYQQQNSYGMEQYPPYQQRNSIENTAPSAPPLPTQINHYVPPSYAYE